jgi:integrase
LAEPLKLKDKVSKSKHTYYSGEMAARVQELMLKHEDQPMGRYVYQFCQVIYYTCTRPNKETRQLKCGDVDWDRKLLRIDPDRAKGGAGGNIPMCDELIALFKEMGVDKAPPEWYIFGKGNFGPGPECYSNSHFMWWFREKIRKPNNLPDDYDLYSWKHTRVVRLFANGATVLEIMVLCRHTKPTTTEDYLRDIGSINISQINDKSQKFESVDNQKK